MNHSQIKTTAPGILPAPFEWIAIPGGEVLLKPGGYLRDGASDQVGGFAISKYPITNAQFAAFIDGGGYSHPDWWTATGWAKRTESNWTEPRYWQSADWNQRDQPVVGVSWHEAMAFCKWLGEAADQPITLPTEQQWQHSAQGDDGREYPWGNTKPTDHLCNWDRNVDETTPVTRYPDGASPFGVMDMVGNVWEWCLTIWETGGTSVDAAGMRMLRGGSWSSDSPLSLWAANRNPGDPNTHRAPHTRDNFIGFRIAVNL